MNILLVDDQVWVLSGMKSGIEWKHLNIDNVYTAGSAEEAKAVFRAQSIDILITDIEMPGESGIDLLRWVKREGYQAETICLTSHAEFEYAKEAMELGCSSYILQPARYEVIAETVRTVGLKVLENRNVGKLINLNEMQIQLIYEAGDKYFMRLLSGSGDRAENWKHFKKVWDVGADYGDQMILILQQRLRWRDETWEGPLERATLMNVLQELLSSEERILISAKIDHDLQAMLLLGKAQLPAGEVIADRLRRYHAFEQEFMPMDTALYYYGILDSYEQIPEAVGETRDMIRRNIMGARDIFFYSGTDQTSVIHDKARVFDTKKWKELLVSGNGEEIQKEISRYFTEYGSSGSLNTEDNALLLKKLHQSFVFSAYQAMETLDFDYATFFPDMGDMTRVVTGYDTFEHLISAIEYVTKRIRQLTPEAGQENEDLVDKAVLYIRNNLDQKLTRKDVSDYVHMNEDYLSRQFKNRTGLGLKEYISKEKIELAKELLSSTGISVSLIAIKTGFNNFSHFSQAFKKAEGISPSEYRELKEKKS